MYSIGDRIVYPMHGAGIIESIEEREILGSKQSYYILKIPVGNMKVMIPIANVDNIGVRDIIDKSIVDDVFSRFKNKDVEQKETNWNKRYRENIGKLKTGDIFEVTDVVHALMIRERDRGLSTGEKKMLSNAKQILISELVLAKGLKQEDVEHAMYDYIYNNRAKAQ